jgi:predicted acyltransferase
MYLQKERLYSLDVFRGITVAAMILVNNPGSWSSVYSPLLHAPWNGCTPTDLIFPFFLFIVGVSIHFAYKDKSPGGLSQKVFLKVLKRSAIIFSLGLFLAWFTLPIGNMFTAERFASLRIPGVLPRIAVVFFFCSLIYLKTNWLAQIRIASLLLVAYYLLMTLVPVPDFGPPNLEPGTNLAAWSDRLLLEGHLWSQSKTWDPEGVLSTLPAIATGLLGMLVGKLFTELKEPREKTVWLFFIGSVLIVGGLAWGLVFPINKALWTSSYVLYTAGIAMQFLGGLYWLIDVQGIKKWSTPFIYYGVNAIFVFVASGLLAKILTRIKLNGADGNEISLWSAIYENAFASWLSPKNASLFFAISLILLFLVLLRWMYKRKIILKV